MGDALGAYGGVKRRHRISFGKPWWRCEKEEVRGNRGRESGSRNKRVVYSQQEVGIMGRM